MNNQPNWNKSLLRHCQTGNLKLVIRALEKGADIHYNNENALRLAIATENFDVAFHLVENGAEINYESKVYLSWGSSSPKAPLYREIESRYLNRQRKLKLSQI